jgi:hypothetical protein
MVMRPGERVRRRRIALRMPKHYLRFAELGIGIFSMLFWVLLLTAGTNIGSKPYRDALADPGNLPFSTLLGDVIIVMLCYTWSNAMFLGTLASFLGGLCRWAQTEIREKSYLSIILPGFLVYVLGVGWMSATVKIDDLVNPSRELYIKLAWLVSLGGFLAGYNRDFFISLTHRAQEIVTGMFGGKSTPRPPQNPES